ncbi:MAG: tail fiber protein [Bdellovibrionia bacterium]
MKLQAFHIACVEFCLIFLYVIAIGPLAYAVTDEQFETLEHNFLQLKAEMGVVSQASYELPIGTIVAWSGGDDTFPPDGYLVCNGQWVKATGFPALQKKVSRAFTDSTLAATRPGEFQLPDFRGRTLVGVASEGCKPLGTKFGSETHTLTTDEIPSHKHNVRDDGHIHEAKDEGHTHEDAGHAHGGASVTTGPRDQAEWKSGFGRGDAFGEQGVSRGGGVYSSKADIQSSKAVITVGSSAAAIKEDSVGGGKAHNICQPSISINYLIKAK